MRASGILMHITSLPSPHGVGTLGKEAYAFADFLEKSAQKYWQLLPLGPTGYGDSPYQTDSAFAGNPYMIDLDELIKDGLLLPEEVCSVRWGDDPSRTDFGALFAGRFGLLRLAYQRGWSRDAAAVAEFYNENKIWLRDYALYTSIKCRYGMRPWTEWEDEDLRMHRREALDVCEIELRESVEQCIYTQFLFFRQWNALRSYIRKKGIRIIGDIPIYVPLDSADVWSGRENFQLDESGYPVEVAGVPPDYFTADGQLWGNPLYDWEQMRENGFTWWKHRIAAASKLYDVVRIDHFRGLESYWAVPYGDTTARGGQWRKGPGEAFIDVLHESFPDLFVIAEDLGYLTPEVIALREYSHYPSMKVLQFAFDSREPSNFLPHLYGCNCVCYVGTHDNATLSQWLSEANPKDVEYAREYLGLNTEEGYARGVLRGGMSSTADIFVAQLQDWLTLGAEARMNVPGTLGGGNWRWRVRKDALTDSLAEEIRRMTILYGRQLDKVPAM